MAGWSPEDDEFRRVRVPGASCTTLEAPVHGLIRRQRGQPVQGFYLFTPLRLADGRTSS